MALANSWVRIVEPGRTHRLDGGCAIFLQHPASPDDAIRKAENAFKNPGVLSFGVGGHTPRRIDESIFPQPCRKRYRRVIRRVFRLTRICPVSAGRHEASTAAASPSSRICLPVMTSDRMRTK